MRVLVTGSFGYIGSHIVAGLVAAGHEVVCGSRQRDIRFGYLPFVRCDFAKDVQVDDWLPRLANIDAVVNAAGILREHGTNKFEVVHRDAPLALFSACTRLGIRKVIEISALGDPRDGEFIASKHRLDQELQKLDLDWIILRPGLVYSTRGSYGGTSLLRAMAATPWVLPVPGDGQQKIQPVAIEDLVQVVVDGISGNGIDRRIIEIVGPEVITVEAYLKSWRQWLGMAVGKTWQVPPALVSGLAKIGEKFSRGPLGLTMLRMLDRGNVASRGSVHGQSPLPRRTFRTMEQSLRLDPSHVQDRWQARLYLLEPLLRASLAFLFVLTAVAGFRMSTASSVQILGYLGVAPTLAPTAVVIASLVDLVLGCLLLTRHHRTAAIGMLMVVVTYTLWLGFRMPGLWFEPFGALIKNVSVIPAILVYLVIADRR